MVFFKKFLPYLLLTLFSTACFLPGIQSVPIFDRDSALFAQASKQMVQTNQYFQVKFQDKPRHLKPPGIYWLQTAVVKLTNNRAINQEWPYQIPSFLGGLFSVLLLFGFARSIVGEKIAFLAGLLLSASLLLIIESHLIVTDAILLVFVVWMQGSLWKIYLQIEKIVVPKKNAAQPISGMFLRQWLVGLRPPALDLPTKQSLAVGAHFSSSVAKTTKTWFWMLNFWLALSLGILIKGLTPLFALLTILTIVIMDRQISWLKQLHVVKGLFLVALITACWLIPISLASHSNFLWDMLRSDALPKVMGAQQSHGQPPGFFLLLLPLMFWPASLFLFHAGVWAWQQRKEHYVRFLIAWIIPIWLFFELMHTKLPEYVLPIYPALAILTTCAIYNFDKNKLGRVTTYFQWAYGILWLLYSTALAIALSFAPYFIDHQVNWIAITIGIIIFITSITALVFNYLHRLKIAAVILLAGSMIAFANFYYWVLPNIDNLWINKKVAAAIVTTQSETLLNQSPLLVIGFEEPSLVFYLGTHNVLYTNLEQAEQNLRDHQSQLFLVEKSQAIFLQAHAKNMKMPLAKLSEISGFNYVKGKFVTLELLKESLSP